MINILRVIIIVVFGLLYRVELKGRENIPASGSALLCANHLGELDMFLIGYRIKRLVRWMAKEELFRNPILGALIKWLGAFPVKRGKGDIDAIKKALSLLKEGHIVGIFPEGTRTRGKSAAKLSVKLGAALLATKAGVPVIPVSITGDYKLFSKVTIVFGKPYMVGNEAEGKLSKEELSEISNNIMKKVYSQVGG